MCLQLLSEVIPGIITLIVHAASGDVRPDWLRYRPRFRLRCLSVGWLGRGRGRGCQRHLSPDLELQVDTAAATEVPMKNERSFVSRRRALPARSAEPSYGEIQRFMVKCLSILATVRFCSDHCRVMCILQGTTNSTVLLSGARLCWSVLGL